MSSGFTRRPLAAALAFGGLALAAPGATDLAQESPIIWVITGISVGGAVITYAFLVYAIYRFRDPKTKGRRYG
ncbi:MAG: hypothetical protein ACREB9_02405 [Thermoplasmata archaeon]